MYKRQELAHIIGVNMEGPLIDIKKKGAQAGEYISVPDACLLYTSNKNLLSRYVFYFTAPSDNPPAILF